MVIKVNLLAFAILLLVATVKPAATEPVRLAQISRESFERLQPSVLSVAGSRLNVAFVRGRFELSKQQRLAWIRRAAEIVAGYFGRFPVPEAHVIVVANSGRGVKSGTAFGYSIPVIRLVVGTSSTGRDFRADWKVVHEMAHLGFPNLAEKHLWLSEGLAVYVERVSLVQAGVVSRERAWQLFVRDMPYGLPGPGDGGLDGTTRWGRIYWGGTIFSLLVDIELRKRTKNRVGLQDILRGGVADGATHDKLWSIDRALTAADGQTSTTVLRDFYKQMGQSSYRPDLRRLWKQLGVRVSGKTVRFDDAAELAQIRKSIMAPRR